MDTWSSVPALVVKESIEAGWHRTLFSDTTDWKQNTIKGITYSIWTKKMCPDIIVMVLPRDAAVQWAIINPEFSPPSGVRKAASSLYAKICKMYISWHYTALSVNRWNKNSKIKNIDEQLLVPGLTSLSILLSLMFASSCTPIAK